jgi:ATP-dependent helicase HrpB
LPAPGSAATLRDLMQPPIPQRLPPPPLLPIDALLPTVLATLELGNRLILQAEPGAGKTTRVPPALLQPSRGEVWVVEPRRMAAVLAARHVAAELGQAVGQTVGFSVRFEEASSPATRLRYLTDGLLLRRLQASPTLPGVSVVILDEFHERRLAMDLALGLLRRLQEGPRPDLRIVVMSATLDADALSSWLDDAPVLHAPGRVHPVTIEHAATLDSRPLEDQVATAVRRLLQEGLTGDVLVFLPGTAEIRRCGTKLAALAHEHDLALRPLHGSLPIAEQERAIAPEGRRKIVLSTNIAETSVTLPRVVAVIDSGLHRSAGHAAWSGLPTLQVARISKASATQRAGRAGRTQPGRCLRLYTQHDHDSRAAYDKPEVLRTDLAEAVLQFAALDLQPDQMAQVWPTPPPPEAVDLAVRLLTDLEALDRQGKVTPEGHQLLRLPLPPRLGRLLLEARRHGQSDAGCVIAALLGERDLRTRDKPGHRSAHGNSDVLALRDAYVDLERHGFSVDLARGEGLDLGAARQVQRVIRQLQDACRSLPPPGPRDPDVDTVLCQAVLAAFPDRVAQRRVPGQPDLLLEVPGQVRLGPRSEVTEPMFLVVVDAEERRDGKASRDAKGAVTEVRLASGIEPSWLLDRFANRVEVQTECTWHAPGRRVVARERLVYACVPGSGRGLVLDESTGPATPGPQAAAILRLQIRAAHLTDDEAVKRLQARAIFARTAGLDVPELDDATLDRALDDLCQTTVNLADLTAEALLAAVRTLLGPAWRRLDENAPETLQLPGGKRTRVHYEAGQTPWVASRLQDFFGMAEGPRLASGRIPVVLHLLAPNQRPVQVTTDLAGFWARHYPTLRKELGRRYPRHAWPEDPLHAEPPPPRR